MEENAKLPLEYCKLDRAARLLGCEVSDLLHWAETGAIQLCVMLNGVVMLSHIRASYQKTGLRFKRLLLSAEGRARQPLRGMSFCLPRNPLSKIAFFYDMVEEEIGGTKIAVPRHEPDIIHHYGTYQCKCMVSGLWAFINSDMNKYFAVLQDVGKVEIKAGFSFATADHSEKNPPRYFACSINEPYDPERILLTISTSDLWITRKQIEKIQKREDIDAMSLANNATTEQEKAEQRGVSKQEILTVAWPLPNGAPTLENILKRIPVWVAGACDKTGSKGGGSHRWNPAMFACCLAVTSSQKKWKSTKPALDGIIRNHYSKYLSEWEEKSAHL